MTIRGLGQVFKALDNNKNKTLDAEELENGFRDFGINLNTQQVEVLVKHFDRDGSKTISFNEFLQAIRVSFVFYHIHLFLISGNHEPIENRVGEKSLLET